MSAEVMQTFPAEVGPASTGSLFSCSRSDIPCHHFCLRHSKPLLLEVEEWFMTDEVDVEEEEEEEEKKQEEAGRSQEEESELMQAGLLDQLLDEAYSQYYEEPDEWDELAHWYTARMNCDEPWDTDHQSGQSPSGAAQQQDFHPAWRQEPAGTRTPGRFARGSESASPGRTANVVPPSSSSHRQQNQPPVGTPSGRPAAAGASTSRDQRMSSEPDPADHRQPHGPKRREWAELVDEQEQEEEMELSASENGHHNHRRGSAGCNETALVREFELYEAFNDLFFPDPESGRL